MNLQAPTPALSLARSAEDAACAYLRKQGYRILFRNYRLLRGEIDIIALDKQVICFVEVKARSSCRFGMPYEAVNAAKKRQLCRLAVAYLKQERLLHKKARFDVLSILMQDGQPQIRLIKNAFAQTYL